MNSLIFLIYALGHMALFVWALHLFLRYRHPATVPLLLVLFGLVYDNAVLAGGAFIGAGDVLEQLSVPRFFMHAFGTPLLILSALGLVRRVGAKWSFGAAAAATAVTLTVLMIAIGVYKDVVSLELAAKSAGDLISYGNAAAAGPPVAPIVTILALVGAGVIVARRGGGPWLLIGSLVQFTAAALGDAAVFIGNLGELALLAALVVTDHRLSGGAPLERHPR